MKNLFIFLSFLLSITVASAQQGPSEVYMSAVEQMKYIDKAAKEIRRRYWIEGHEHVESRQAFLTKKVIDDLVASSNNYHGELDSEEVSEVYRCHYRKTCEVYLVNLISSYYSGWGQNYYYLLLDTKKRRHEEYSHLVYAE